MIVSTPDWTLVIVGSWNMAILNPAWVAKELFEVDSILTEMLLGGPIYDLRYTHGALTIVPRPDRVVISMSDTGDATLTKAENIAIKLLTKLPQTPVTSMGVNFGYVEPNPNNDLLALFRQDDDAKLIEAGLTLSASNLLRKITRADGRVLNFRRSLDQDNLAFHFNFHNDIPSGVEGIALLTGSVIGLKNETIKVMNDAYSLSLEQGT